MSPQDQAQQVEPIRWLEALLDPAVALRFETYGFITLPLDWRVQDRRVPELVVYAVVDGEISAEVAGKRWRLRRGGFCLLPPGTLHTFALSEHLPPAVLHFFRFELSRNAEQLQVAHPPVVLEAATGLREHLDRLHEDRQSRRPDAAIRIRATLALLFSSALRQVEAPQANPRTLSDAQRYRLYEFIRGHQGTPLRPADLAAHLGLSADHFTRVFRATFGMPPRRWLVEQRTRYAAIMLADSTLTISQISVAAGYPDIYQFSRQFKQVMGVSPRAYRRDPSVSRG